MGKKSKEPSLSSRKAHLVRKQADYPHRITLSIDGPKPEAVAVSDFGHYAAIPFKEYGKREWLFETMEGARLFLKRFGPTMSGVSL